MTTVVDPLGTPSVAYNKSGKNIQNITLTSDSSFEGALAINPVSEVTVLIATVSGGGSGVGAIALSSDFDIGDVVIVYGVNRVNVYDSDGNGHGTTATSSQFSTVCNTWMKIASDNWIIIN